MFDINVTVTLVSCIKSEITDCRTAAWFLKPLKERVEENHYLWPSKTNSIEYFYYSYFYFTSLAVAVAIQG